ncbi:phage tail length tape measure family protein [Sinorhizobium meliloti]|nr:phage tail length tape measure family protein [Sinorhizobium meliloti]
MSERLGEALLDLRTNDKGFNAGIKRAEGGAQKLGGTLDQTSDKADNLSERMRSTGAALRNAGEASSAAAGAAMQETAALYRMDAAAMAASKASVALAQAEYKKASAALASARADGEATKEAIAAAAAMKQKAFASLEAARADNAAVIASQRVAAAAKATAPAIQAVGQASKNAALQQKLLVFQLNDVFVSLASGMPLYLVAIQQGSQMAQIWGPGEGGLGRALKETGKMAVNAATRFPLLMAAVALGAAAIAGMTYEVNRASDVTVGFGDVALATWETIADGLSDLLKPAIDAMAPWFQSAWDIVVSGVKTTGNEIINSFHAAGVDVALVAETIATHFEHSFETVKIIWSTLPAVLGDIVYSTAKSVVDGIEAMINGAVDRINKLNEYLPEWAQFDGIDKIDLPGIENPNAGAATDTAKRLKQNAESEVAEIRKIWGDRNARITEIMTSDPLGDFFNAVEDRSVENALEREKEKKGKSGGDTSGRTDAEKYQDLVRSAEQFIQAQTRERQSIGLTAEAASRLRYEQELLNAAANDNIKLTPQQTAELKRLAGEMAVAEAETTRLQESFDFARDVAGGFVSDVRQGLEDGKDLFKSFADAAVGALNRVIDKILNEALDALFQLGSAGSNVGSGGGFLGGIGNIFSSLFSGFFAKGGLIPSGTFGIVGEKGPEPVIGTSRGAMVLPNSSLKGRQGGGDAGGMHITFGVDVDDNGRLSAYVKNVARTESSTAAQGAVAAYDRGLPDRVQQINANPRRR